MNKTKREILSLALFLQKHWRKKNMPYILAYWGEQSERYLKDGYTVERFREFKRRINESSL